MVTSNDMEKVTTAEMVEQIVNASNLEDKEGAIEFGLKRAVEKVELLYGYYMTDKENADFYAYLLCGMISKEKLYEYSLERG